MEKLARTILETHVPDNNVAIFWIAQAGFVYKTPADKIIYIDPYLTDSVHRQLADMMYGFKRIMMTPIEPEEVVADFVIATHSHPDHLDSDLVPVLARRSRPHFIGAPDCRARYLELGLGEDRFTILHRGDTLDLDELRITAAYADHGELAPDALGIILQVGDIRIWQTGDTGYRPEMWQEIFEMEIDIVIPPINGAYGNMNAAEAASLARDAGARVAIPCHFWMFAEHGGEPLQFLEACKERAPGVRPVLMAQGEMFMYSK